MRVLRQWAIVVVALVLGGLPGSAAAATGPAALKAANTARNHADRVLVARAVAQRRCARVNPARCTQTYLRLQRAGRALEKAETRFTQLSAVSAINPPREAVPALRSHDGRLSWQRIAGVRTYLVLRQGAGMADHYAVVVGSNFKPPAVPGAGVTYSVRSAARNAKWSKSTVVTYAPKPRSDPRSAPMAVGSGGILSWQQVGRVRSYIVVRTIPGSPSIYTSVTGTSLALQHVAGARATYSVRTAIVGSTWSPATSVPFAAVPAAPTASALPGAPTTGNPFAGQRLYVDPDSSPAKALRQLSQQSDAAEAALISKLASQPMATWFGDWTSGHGGTAGDVSWSVGNAASSGAMPVLVAYDIPGRDCGGYSGGGATSPGAYRTFIDGMVQGIAGRRVAVIVEPDALAELECETADQQASTLSLLNYAVTRLSSSPNTAVYLDAGNSGWEPAATMVTRLQQAGVANARGFSLNVSNFKTTTAETAYATSIAAGLPGKHAVIDTSRNGRGPTSDWCNPPGRGLGTPPTSQTTSAVVDAYLWIKIPGESDGACNGGPAPGEWFSSYALDLARNAAF